MLSLSAHCAYLGLEGLDGLGGQPELDKGLALLPPHALPMQVHLLQLVLTPIGEGEAGRERDGQSEGEGGKEGGREGRREGVVACCGPQVSASTFEQSLFPSVSRNSRETFLT
jgi:hypothetical protein